MWASLLRGGFGELLALASPGLFSLLPARDLERALRRLTANRRDLQRIAEAKSARQATLVRARLPIHLDPEAWKSARSAEKMGDLSGLSLPPREVGSRVLRLYFHQLFDPSPTLLELHSRTFAQKDGELDWSGGNLFVEWNGEFITPLRELYVGYYQGDSARYRAALEPLGLTAAEEELKRQFGGADPGNVTFDLAEFRSTFIAILKRCRDAGARLHPDFIPLGIYLACLYEHMAALGGAYDVRAAFDETLVGLKGAPRRDLSEQSAAL